MPNSKKITTLGEFQDELRKQISSAKKNLLVVTPIGLETVVESLAQTAFAKKRVKFVYVAQYDLKLFNMMIIKMKVLGNIQFRQLEGIGTFWGCNRDDNEVIFGTGSGDTMHLTVSQDPADVERIKVKMTAEILPSSKVL